MKAFTSKIVFVCIGFCVLILFYLKDSKSFVFQKSFDIFYEKPLHNSELVYEEVVSDPEWSHALEISRRYDSQEQLWFAKIQGYSHTYRFQKFGILLQLKDPYQPLFLQKTPENPFLTYVYSGSDTLHKKGNSFLIQKFKKNKKSEFTIGFLERYQESSGCLFEKFVYYDYLSSLLTSISFYQSYHLFSLDGSSCDAFGNTSIYFVYTPKHPDYYYKLSWQDQCAPTCGIPYYFEIL